MNQQYIVVSFEHDNDSRAKLSFCEKNNQEYKIYLNNCKAYSGKCGFTNKKTEGDRKTPVGNYPITSGFGMERIEGVKIPYVITSSRHVWVDDPESEYYNTMQLGRGNGKWKSAEKLNIPAYKYALVIGYNVKPAVPYCGSAIFIHCMTDNPYTEGCIAIKEKHMHCLISNIDIYKNPIIIIDSMEKMKKKRELWKDASDK